MSVNLDLDREDLLALAETLAHRTSAPVTPEEALAFLEERLKSPALQDGIRKGMAISALQGAFSRLAPYETGAPVTMLEALAQTISGMMSAESPEYGRLMEHCLQLLKRDTFLAVTFREGAGWGFKNEHAAKAFALRAAESVATLAKGYAADETSPPTETVIDTLTNAGGLLPQYVCIGRRSYTAIPGAPAPSPFVEEVPPLL